MSAAAAAPIARHRPSSSAIPKSAAANPSRSRSATSTPVTPSRTASGIPPCSVATTGNPVAIASSIAFGTPS